MKYGSFCFVNKNTSSVTSDHVTYKGCFAETHTERKFPDSSLETRLSVEIRSTISRKAWMKGREKYAIHYLDGQTACI